MAHITLTGARADTSILDRVSAVITRFNEWRSYRRTVTELAGLTDRELTDIGISRADIAAVARGDRSPIVR
jgi:uncharacterized protein YjiS (DUF1127 family)